MPSLKTEPVKYWLNNLEKEKKAHDKFRKQAQKSAEAARDDDESKKQQFNIHWANCRIVKSAIFATRPKPDVRRRYQKADPEEKELARLVERGIEYQLDTNDFETPSMAVVKDYVQTALGVPRVVYDVDTAPIPDPLDPEIEQLAILNGLEIPQTFDQGLEEIVNQAVGLDHVPWKHFHWEPGHSSWKNVNWIAIELYKPPKDIEAEYGVKLKAGDSDEDSKREAEKYGGEVQLFEIYHKPSRKVYLIARGHDEPLDEYDDKLNLQGFYPVPRPAFDNLKSDELIPKPDYEFIFKLVEELNRLSQRRSGLVRHIKSVRMYDASIADALTQLENATDGANIPVENMSALLEAAGSGGNAFERMIADLPMADRVAVVRELDNQVESVKQQIYEVIGISDIVRGATKASETAAAQQIKGQWANVRLSDKQAEVNRLWRDVLRMMAEIMCEHFDPMQLQLMTGIEVTPRMQEMMKSDVGRTFAIDIETDSTILRDDQEDKKQKLELVNVLLEKLSFVLPLVQQGVMPVEIVQEILLFIVSSHKHGKQLEDSITGLGEQLSNLQNIQQLQGQLQQAQQQLQGVQQQAGQQIQQLQGQLAQVNQREEARKDAKVQIKAQDKGAEVDLDKAKTAEIYHGMAQPQEPVIYG